MKIPLSNAFAAGCFIRSISHLILALSLMTMLSACQGMKIAAFQREEGSTTRADVERAQQAWQVMQKESPGTEAANKALLEYNRSVARLVKSLRYHEQTRSWKQEIILSGPRPWRLTLDTPSRSNSARTLSLSDFSQCQLASEVKLQGFDRVVARHGMGIPVVLSQKDPRRLSNPFHSTQGEFLPATAVLEFPPAMAGHPMEAKLRFYNPLSVSGVSVGPHARPLAENLTAPLQCLLTDDIPDKERVPSIHDEIESQLFFLNRYDKTRTPLVFVHGLRCGPSVWKNSINELFADPVLRRRYQPVCFIYPTQLSIPASAARLRGLLKRSRDTLDPDHTDGGYDQIVLVGHSMGGLLARMQVIDSGRDFWNAFFTVSPPELANQIDAETAKMVKESLFFQRQRNVGLVVYISTPHRGSVLADIGMIRLVAQIILTLPETAGKHLQALTSLPPAYVHPALRSFNAWGVDATENLSTKHPYFRALARRPMVVPYHSIIASRNPADFRNSDDGCVPYWSSHLDGAVSETIVPYPHACLEKPETVQALLKLLKRAR